MSASVEFHTSGSTGKAKSIVKTKASLDGDAAMLGKSFADLFGEKPFFLTTVQPEHMYGALWRCRLPACVGSGVYDRTIVSVEELLFAASGKSRTLLVTTPSFLEKAVENGDFANLKASLAGIVTSGSLLSASLSKRVYDLTGISPTEIFGSTETGSVAWRRQALGEEWTLFDDVEAERDAQGLLSVVSPYAISKPFVMADRVEFVSSRRFRLLGRADRNVKILEKYVSLADLEAALEKHPFIAKAHAIASDEPIARVRAIVMLSNAGKEELKKSSYAAITARIKRETAEIEPFAFPRRIRYLNSFPYNEQGKLVRSTVAGILESRYQEPVAECECLQGGRFSSMLTFIPDAVYFDGHFPVFKILPGVIQLDYVERCIRRSWNLGAFAGEVSRLKFQRPVQPGENVSLGIERLAENRFSFAIKCGDSPCTSGVFAYSRTENKPAGKTKKVPGVLLAFAMACSFLLPAHASMPAGFESALRRALDADASWTMTKTFASSPVAIKLEGVVSCAKAKGIVWRCEKPFPSSIEMTPKEMVFRDGGSKRTVSVSDLPCYEDVCEAVDSFLAGEKLKFEELFRISASESDGKWVVEMSPKRSDMAMIVKSVTLKGAETLEWAQFFYRSGEKAAFEFKETGRSTHALWKDGR